MDCEHAREQLEAARPDSPEREDSELRAAFAHLDECRACAEVYNFRRAFDRRVRTVVRQVDVPSDLQSRLLTALATIESARPSTTVGGESAARTGSRTSRRAFLLATSAASLLIAAGWTWLVNHQPPAPLSASTVLDWWQQRLSGESKFDIASLPECQFELKLTDGRWESRVQGLPRGVDFDEDGRQDCAVFPMANGFLVVLPPGRVSDPPSATSPVTATPGYAPAPHVAWTQGGSMHICYLPGGSSRELKNLLNKVNSAA
jgi:hypothetical protein